MIIFYNCIISESDARIKQNKHNRLSSDNVMVRIIFAGYPGGAWKIECDGTVGNICDALVAQCKQIAPHVLRYDEYTIDNGRLIKTDRQDGEGVEHRTGRESEH